VKWVGAIAATILLAGCGTPYKEPSTGDLGQLEVVNNSSRQAQLMLFEKADQCTDGHFATYIPAGEQRSVRIAAHQRLAFATTLAPSRERALLGAIAGAAGGAVGGAVAGAQNADGNCRMVVDFLPETGKTYVMQVRRDACLYDFYAQTDEQRGTARRTYARYMPRVWKTPFSMAGPFCN